MSRSNDPFPGEHYASVAAHFASASSGRRKLAVLAGLVTWADAKAILEIGTGYGLSAIAMANAQKIPHLVTIEGFEPQLSISRRHLADAFPDGGVEQRGETKDTAIKHLVEQGYRFDFVLHDGGHNGDAYVQDFLAVLPILDPGTVYLVDDIRWDAKPARRARVMQSRRTCHEGWLEVIGHSRVEIAAEFGDNLGIALLN